jgi:hypothetical protein
MSYNNKGTYSDDDQTSGILQSAAFNYQNVAHALSQIPLFMNLLIRADAIFDLFEHN